MPDAITQCYAVEGRELLDHSDLSEEELSYGPKQADIPHLVCGRLINSQCLSHSKPNAVYDGSSGCVFETEDVFIDMVVTCEQPSFFNSGSHRIIFHGYMGVEDNTDFESTSHEFLLVVEETETPVLCNFVSERVYLAFEDDYSLDDDRLALVMSAVYAVTNVNVYLPSDIRGEEPLSRFEFIDASYTELLSQGCTLSEEADRCIFNVL